ncbi:MAG: 5-formyltetrahydrofolate cyclo-ligase [Casimicrobiaceae bacterium]
MRYHRGMGDASTQVAGTLTGHPLHGAKRALRVAMIAARDGIDAELHRASSRRIADTIIASPAFTAAGCVMLTLPHKSEWDMRPVFDAALAMGKTVVLPRVNIGRRMLDLHRVSDFARDVGTGYRGIPEPLDQTPRMDAAAIDWILVPGVAFDLTGRRLGYGGGFYDRLLSHVPARVPRIAGAFDLQVVPQVPAAPHDLTVDRIVTEQRDLALSGRG